MAKKPAIHGQGSATEGLQPGKVRYTAIADVKAINMLKDYAYTNRITYQAALNEIITKFFEIYLSDPKNELLRDPRRGSDGE